jgi:hypothetical protein
MAPQPREQASPRDDQSDELLGPDPSLKTFIFEVSAGRPKGVADATDVQLRIDSPSPDDRKRTPIRRRRELAQGTRDAAVTAVVNTSPTGSGVNPRAVKHSVAKPRPKIRTAKRRRVPPLFASATLHAAIVAVLFLEKLPGIEPLQELLWATAPPVEEVVFADVNFETGEDELSTIAEEDVPAELMDPGKAAFGQADTAAALADIGGEPSVAAGTLGGDLGALFGQSGAGLAQSGSGLGDAPTAQFFGQKIEGRRIVFVLDNSGSMQGGRLETVIAELLRCVDSLDEKQEFYVIFHSDTVYPLYYPDPVDRYLGPTEANKRMLARWLDTVELCLGDSVDEALAAAAMIEPDAVFLLSDGRIQGQRTLRFLLDGRSRNFPIHTFAVGMGSSVAGRRNLEEIAAANGGEFRESEIPPEMRELARQNPRPYHSEAPGRVWGPKVKPFRIPRTR